MTDKTVFLRNFLYELEECLNDVHGKLIILEGDYNNNGIIKHIFRLFHTIKGNAALLNLNRLKVLVHNIEELLDSVNKGKIQIDGDFIKVIWEGVKLVGELLQKIKTGEQMEYSDKNEEGFILLLNEYLCNLKRDCNLGKLTNQAKFFYKNIDLTEIVSDIEEFLRASIHHPPEFSETERFISALNNLSGIFIDFKEPELVSYVSRIIESIEVFQEDDGAINNHSRRIINENISKIYKHVDKVTVNSYKSRENTIIKSFRVDESKIDEILLNISELKEIGNSLYSSVISLNGKSGDLPIIEKLKGDLILLKNIHQLFADKIVNLKFDSLNQLFKKIEHIITSLSVSCNKKVIILASGHNVLIERDKIESLENILLHILRNCVDHGIELPKERIEKGKPEEGVILLDVIELESEFHIKISDDGKGINFDEMKKASIEKGLIDKTSSKTITNEALIELAFVHGVSTSSKITDISGRGIGLNIVLQNLLNMGGTFSVDSVPDKGVSFLLKLPKGLRLDYSINDILINN